MIHTDPRVDAYLQKIQPFALPIIEHLRELVHKNCPEVQETWKWSFPAFMYKKSILCGIAAFKEHCSFGFWLASEMKDPYGILKEGDEREGMGHLGKITSLDDLPDDGILGEYIKQAMQLIDKGVKLKKKPSAGNKELQIPDFLLSALQINKKAKQTFDSFSYTKKKDYVDWLIEAKTEATRAKRLEQALEWMAEGKGRNWKYEKR